TGKPAQFGRGVMAEVGAKLIGMFAGCLAEQMTAGELGAAGPATPEGSSGTPAAAVPGGPSADGAQPDGGQGRRTSPPPPPQRPSPEVIDLLGAAGAPLLKRMIPVLAGLAALIVVLMGRRLRHGRCRGR
ncbi:MAG: SRPBCC family protein, partial [Actinomycetes bacterium]